VKKRAKKPAMKKKQSKRVNRSKKVKGPVMSGSHPRPTGLPERRYIGLERNAVLEGPGLSTDEGLEDRAQRLQQHKADADLR
jgi:hypothetical protein